MNSPYREPGEHVPHGTVANLKWAIRDLPDDMEIAVMVRFAEDSKARGVSFAATGVACNISAEAHRDPSSPFCWLTIELKKP